MVRKVQYEPALRYTTFDASSSEVIRLTFLPGRVTAGTLALPRAEAMGSDCYTVQLLEHGDYVVRVQHSSARDIVIAGE